MIKLVKVSKLYLGYTAYKTDAEINDKENIITNNVDGYTIMKDQKREIFLNKSGRFYHINDVNKYKLSKKDPHRISYPVLSLSELDKIIPGRDTIIKETLEKLNLPNETSDLDNNEIVTYFGKNLESEYLPVKKLIKLNNYIR